MMQDDCKNAIVKAKMATLFMLIPLNSYDVSRRERFLSRQPPNLAELF
jgi:hypothetical protein